jgi:uncharacterized protein DUF3105
VFAIFGGDDSDTVSVPPVRETELTKAAGRSGCVLRSVSAGTKLNPPVDGAAGGRPARAGFYADPIATAQLVAAIRHGIVVIQFRRGLADKGVKALKSLQTAFPTGTIVAPNATRMHFAIAVTAYRRFLGCQELSPRVLDAIQLFRGRFLGSGPDS